MIKARDWEFKTVTIVGFGLIGGSLGMALRRRGFDGELLAVSSADTINQARSQGVIDEGFPYESLMEPASRSQLVILASPIHRILEQLDQLGDAGSRLTPGTVISDVGSTKKAIRDRAAAALPEGVHFVGGHPMAGSEQRGFQAADPFLFQNAYYLLTPGEGVPAKVVSQLERFLTETGARMLVLDADDHDRTAAVISHVPQLLAVSLVNFLDRSGVDHDTAVRLAAGGFRDMTRIASSSFEMWRDIFATNAEGVRHEFRRFSDYLDELASLIGNDQLEELFTKAAETRARIPRDSKGFLNPLAEVLVVVEDQPGVIAGISNALAERGINIKDIEVLKVREDEGGTLRLAFSSETVAKEAIEILTKQEFSVRLRE